MPIETLESLKENYGCDTGDIPYLLLIIAHKLELIDDTLTTLTTQLKNESK